MKLASIALAVSALSMSSAALAVDYSYTGTTVGGPTFNRPVSLASLSAVGTAVAYSTLTFSVTADGSYSFLSASTTPLYDNFTALYLGSFVPASGLVNLIALNDDLGNTSTSGFTTALATGSTYVFVTTGFDNLDVGSFSNTISGPGSVITSAVPEPETYALMAFGLAGICLLARRRSAGTSAGSGA